jgi:hypothetical protein
MTVGRNRPFVAKYSLGKFDQSKVLLDRLNVRDPTLSGSPEFFSVWPHSNAKRKYGKDRPCRVDANRHGSLHCRQFGDAVPLSIKLVRRQELALSDYRSGGHGLGGGFSGRWPPSRPPPSGARRSTDVGRVVKIEVEWAGARDERTADAREVDRIGLRPPPRKAILRSIYSVYFAKFSWTIKLRHAGTYGFSRSDR